MANTLVSGSSCPGSSPGCVVYLGNKLYSRSASVHPGVQMGTGELTARGNPAID